ncbi:MAG: UvrB/UvrC motif-containing protein, partial [Aquificaceae bacterium]
EPCLDYHLGLCCAPCCGYISKKEYNLSVRSAMSLLSGDVSSILEELYRAIEEYSSSLQFERCAQIRDQIYALENLAKGQKVSGIPLKHGDIFYTIGKVLGIFLIRTSKLVDKQIVYLEREEEREEVLLGFYYANPISEKVITNFELSHDVKEWLKKRGNPKFLTYIDKEIEDIIRKNLGNQTDLKALEEEFTRTLHIPMPKVIEGFDVSHFYGEYTVGSCVVWKEGIMDKRRYRRYRVKSSKAMDDYSSLREILIRRAKRLKCRDEVMPDAWLVDGGHTQLNVAISIKREFGLPIHIFALAKEEEVLLNERGMGVSLKDNLLLYRVFGSIRDEAHRFALSYNRNLRLKEGMKDVLSCIKGIGEVKRRIIYRNFENLYELLSADEQRLKRLGINPSLKQEVKKYLSETV